MNKRLLKFPFPLIVAVVYIFIGVLLHVWHPTWMLFLLIPAWYEIVTRIGRNTEDMTTYQILKAVPVTSVVIIAYLVMGFLLHLWHPGWLVFLIIPIYYSLLPMFKQK